MQEQLSLETYIEQRQVSGELLSQLRELDSATSRAVERLVSALTPSANALRDLLSLASEVAAREKVSLDTILTEEKIAILLGSSESQQGNKKQLYAEVKQYLFSRRYPEVAQIQNRLLELQRELITKYKVRVELPPELEGDRIAVSFSARGARDLADFAESLSAAANSSQLGEIFSILKGQQ